MSPRKTDTEGYVVFGPCPYCEQTIQIKDRGKASKNQGAYGYHVSQCKRAQVTEEKKQYRMEQRQKNEIQKAKMEQLVEQSRQIRRENRRRELTPNRSDFEAEGSPLGVLDGIIDRSHAIAVQASPEEREGAHQRTTNILSRIFKRTPNPKSPIQPLDPAPFSFEFLDGAFEDDPSEGEEIADSTSDSTPMDQQQLELLVEKRAQELAEIKFRRLRGSMPAVPSDSVEEDFLLVQEPEGAEATQQLIERKPVGDKPIDPMEQRARILAERGFVFRDRASVTKNLRDFKQAVRFFMTQNKFEAIYSLYGIFIHTFIEWSGGYGLSDHKKKIFSMEVAKIDRTFRHLKGELRGKKEFKDLRRFVETNLFPRINNIIWAVMLDTSDKREKDKHEVRLRIADAYVSGIEEEVGGMDDLSRYMGGEEKTEPETEENEDIY